MNRISRGVLAGAAGTTFLNAVTYLDMAVRGRPASPVPDRAVDVMADRAGVSLGEGETADNRRTGTGALLGLLTGMAAGAAYGLVRPLAPGVPRSVAALAVGLGTMAATDAGNVSLGLTHPRDWSAADWASDVVPHLAFGAGVVQAFDAASR